MDRRGSSTWIVAALAIAVGFLAALVIVGNNNDKGSSATVATTTASGTQTTSTTTAATPEDPAASIGDCIKLWNEPANRGDQVFLVNVAAHQPIRVHVGETSDVPPKCLVTVVGNNGDAYVIPSAGGSTYPYAQAPGTTPASTLPAAQKTTNALDQSDGTLTAR